MGIPLQTKSYYDNGAGIDTNSSPTKVAENASSLCLNIDFSRDGAFFTRNGSTIQNQTANVPAQISGAPKMLALYDYRKSDGTEVIVSVGDDGKIYEGLNAPVASVTGLTTGGRPDFEFVVTNDNEFLIFGDGINENLKFDGTTWTNLSLPRPAAPSAADNGAGVLSAGTYQYYVSYARTVGGVIVQESELSPAGSVTLAASRQAQVTFTACSETLASGVTAQCNARVLYRTSLVDGVAYRLTTIANNVALTYNDNTADSALSSIEADFDNQATPKTAVFELDDYGQLWVRDEAQKTDAYVTKAYLPWTSPTENLDIFDGELTCIRRCFGALIFGTNHPSLWLQNGPFATTDKRRFSSTIGILNNRCAAGESLLYIIGTNKQFYRISPTDFSQSEMRISEPLSILVGSYFTAVGASNIEEVSLEYYTKANESKVMVSIPYGTPESNYVMVFNETQSQIVGSPVWSPWNNINAACLKQMIVGGEIGLYSGDYNGFIWLLDDTSRNGDGAEENGTVTSATSTIITDTSQTWVVNELVGKPFHTIAGAGNNQTATVVSNTANTATITPALSTALDTSTEYTIGGYDVYFYTNWKFVIGSYDTLKQLWFLLANANASGDYPIKVILQYDFDLSTSNQVEINFTLASTNTIWGAFLWGAATWGAATVFQSRYRTSAKFRAMRMGFFNRKAGQPFQINGFSISAQDKQLFYRMAT